MMQGATTAVLALVECSRGDVRAARARATTAIALCEEVGDRSYAIYAHQVLGLLELSVGNAGQAHEHLATYSIERGLEGTKRIAFAGDDVEALVGLGRLDEAARLADEVERRGTLLHRPGLIASAARGRGLVLGALGDLDGALRSAERAVDLGDPEVPFERARSMLALGDIQRRAKRWAAARETLVAAAAAFDALGAQAWSHKVSEALARVGGRVRQDGLTATELRVATLVARGLTNKEVAAELYVTVRAVEANLSRIYAKLDVRSRTELATRL